MKKMRKLVIFLFLIAMVVSIAGCSKSKKKNDDNNKSKKVEKKVANFVLNSDNTFTIIYEEEFNESYYDQNELDSMIDSEISEFNSNYAAPTSSGMSKESLSVESGKARLSLKFINYQDYMEYEKNYVDSKRNARIFIGKYDDAVSEGYRFAGSFADLSGNKIDDIQSIATGEGVYVLFTNQGFNMELPGEVVAANSPVTLDEETGLIITTDRKENYIIYKID